MTSNHDHNKLEATPFGWREHVALPSVVSPAVGARCEESVPGGCPNLATDDDGRCDMHALDYDNDGCAHCNAPLSENAYGDLVCTARGCFLAEAAESESMTAEVLEDFASCAEPSEPLVGGTYKGEGMGEPYDSGFGAWMR